VGASKRAQALVMVVERAHRGWASPGYDLVRACLGRSKKPVFLAVNKIEGGGHGLRPAEEISAQLGIKNVYAISGGTCAGHRRSAGRDLRCDSRQRRRETAEGNIAEEAEISSGGGPLEPGAEE